MEATSRHTEDQVGPSKQAAEFYHGQDLLFPSDLCEETELCSSATCSWIIRRKPDASLTERTADNTGNGVVKHWNKRPRQAAEFPSFNTLTSTGGGPEQSGLGFEACPTPSRS